MSSPEGDQSARVMSSVSSRGTPPASGTRARVPFPAAPPPRCRDCGFITTASSPSLETPRSRVSWRPRACSWAVRGALENTSSGRPSQEALSTNRPSGVNRAARMTPSRKVACSIWGSAESSGRARAKIDECPECTEQERDAGERDEPGALRGGGLPERATNGWRGAPEQLQGKGRIGRGLKTTGRLLLQAASNNLGDGGRDFDAAVARDPRGGWRGRFRPGEPRGNGR